MLLEGHSRTQNSLVELLTETNDQQLMVYLAALTASIILIILN